MSDCFVLLTNLIESTKVIQFTLVMRRSREGFHRPTEGQPWCPWKDTQRDKRCFPLFICESGETCVPLKKIAAEIEQCCTG